jgi:hypothetical protein
MVSAAMEVTLDEGVGGGEPRCLFERFEPLHPPLSSSRWPVRVLSPIIRLFRDWLRRCPCPERVAANVGAWLWAWIAFADRPALLGTAFLAYMFGLRHAFDADHIAAINNVVRKLMQEGNAPYSVGFFFSLDHSTIVVLASIAIAATAAAMQGKLDAFHDLGGAHRDIGISVFPAGYRYRQSFHPIGSLADARIIMGESAFLLGSHLEAERAGYAEVGADGEHFTIEGAGWRAICRVSPVSAGCRTSAPRLSRSSADRWACCDSSAHRTTTDFYSFTGCPGASPCEAVTHGWLFRPKVRLDGCPQSGYRTATGVGYVGGTSYPGRRGR